MARLFNILVLVSIVIVIAQCGNFSPKKREDPENGPPKAQQSDVKIPSDWDGFADYTGGNWKLAE